MLRQVACVLDQLLSQQALRPGAWGSLASAAASSHELIPMTCPHQQHTRNVQTKRQKPAVQVVLLQDVAGLGRRGQVVPANPGWVRHRLFPRGAALYATPENVQRFAKADLAETSRRGESIDDVGRQMVSMLRMLSHRVVDVSRKANELDNLSSSTEQGSEAAGEAAGPSQQGSDSMVGSVTAFDIQQCVRRQIGIQLDASHLLMTEPITSFGTFKVPLNLRMLDDHQVELNVRVHRVKKLRHGRASV